MSKRRRRRRRRVTTPPPAHYNPNPNFGLIVLPSRDEMIMSFLKMAAAAQNVVMTQERMTAALYMLDVIARQCLGRALTSYGYTRTSDVVGLSVDFRARGHVPRLFDALPHELGAPHAVVTIDNSGAPQQLAVRLDVEPPMMLFAGPLL